MPQLLITGGTGLIGTPLVHKLCREGFFCWVISRFPNENQYRLPRNAHLVKSIDDIPLSTDFMGVINLAGAPIGDARWTRKRKQLLFDSRVALTENLVEFISKLEHKPEFLISGSAVGFYGAREETETTRLDEQSTPLADFTHELCFAWEQAALKAAGLGVRVCLLRTGVVLARNGGMLQKLFAPFYFGVGGRIGSGKQVLSWVHLQDAIDVIMYLIKEKQLRGPFNVTSPYAVSNNEFVKAFGETIHRPALLPLPALAVKILFGDMGEALLLKGQRVYPARLLEAGFVFRQPYVETALMDIYSRR